jgi:hypothetical protein
MYNSRDPLPVETMVSASQETIHKDVGRSRPVGTLRSQWCPNNGCGMVNGAAIASPRSEDCPHCGYPAAQIVDGVLGRGLTTHHKFCPNCYRCLECNRIIRRKADVAAY